MEKFILTSNVDDYIVFDEDYLNKLNMEFKFLTDIKFDLTLQEIYDILNTEEYSSEKKYLYRNSIATEEYNSYNLQEILDLYFKEVFIDPDVQEKFDIYFFAEPFYDETEYLKTTINLLYTEVENSTTVKKDYCIKKLSYNHFNIEGCKKIVFEINSKKNFNIVEHLIKYTIKNGEYYNGIYYMSIPEIEKTFIMVYSTGVIVIYFDPEVIE